jgi:superfamily II DNA/RNA helicase
MPPEITRLVERFLHNPVRVEVSKPASIGESITQRLIPSGGKPNEKRATLRALIKGATDLTNAIIFCNRKRDVATVYRSLERHGFSVGALHGDMDQHARLQTLESFRENRITLLVASDVAARGLDIPAVSHIFNFDVPTHSEDYVHRIGRTGRAGRTGEALTIVTKPEAKYIQSIEKLIGTEIPWGEAPAGIEPASDDDGEGAAPARRERGGRPPRGENRDESGGRERGAPRRARGRRAEESKPRAERASPDRPEAPEPARQRADRAEARPDVRRRAQAGSSRMGEPKPRRPESEGLEDASRAVGFADHVPAFLLRPVRVPREAELVEEG